MRRARQFSIILGLFGGNAADDECTPGYEQCACEAFTMCAQNCVVQCNDDQGRIDACQGLACGTGEEMACTVVYADGRGDWTQALSCSIRDECPNNCDAAANCP